MALAAVESNESPAPSLDELVEQGRQVASQISSLDAALVDIVRQIRQLDHEHWGMTTRQYLSWQLGLTPAESARLCRLQVRLEALPLLRGELEAGRLSADTVATLAAVGTPDNEAALIETATVATGAQLQRLVRSYKQNTVHTQPEDEDRSLPTDVVTYGIRDGRWTMRADLAPELGAQVEAALRAEKEAAIDDAEGKDDGQGPLSRDPEVSNAAALVRMSNSVLAGKVRRNGILPERFQILIHLEEDGAHVQGGGFVEHSSITELLCESWITALVTRNGQPITITSPTRLATPAQQRALLARDRTCRFPGCGRTSYLKAHHVIYDTEGGPTQLDNLCLLCQVHHTLIHKPGWHLERDGAGVLVFTAPNGRVVLPGRRPPPTDPPRPGRRYWGTYDPLTAWGSSVILNTWMN